MKTPRGPRGIARVAADLFLERANVRLTLFLRYARPLHDHVGDARVRLAEGAALDVLDYGTTLKGKPCENGDLIVSCKCSADLVVKF